MDTRPTQVGPLYHKSFFFFIFITFGVLFFQLFFILEGGDPGSVVAGKVCVADAISVHGDKITQGPKQGISVIDTETLHR